MIAGIMRVVTSSNTQDTRIIVLCLFNLGIDIEC